MRVLWTSGSMATVSSKLKSLEITGCRLFEGVSGKTVEMSIFFEQSGNTEKRP